MYNLYSVAARALVCVCVCVCVCVREREREREREKERVCVLKTQKEKAVLFLSIVHLNSLTLLGMRPIPQPDVWSLV